MSSIRNWIWLICGIIAVSLGGYMLLFTPHTREVVSLGMFIPKLLALLFMVFAVAFFPNKWKYGYVIGVLLIFAFLIPYENALSWAWFGNFPDEIFTSEFTEPFGQTRQVFTNEMWTAFYILLLPSFIYGIALAFRMGGGSTEHTVKIGLSGLLVYFSCLNIFIFQTIFHVRWGFPYSEVASWVYHVSYFIGRDPLFYELLYWLAAFMVLLILVNVAPLGKWGLKIAEKLGI
ncbi:MAG: hypothetical protein HXS54_03465 [Theionarchaea archaeon]|nr:hypothetical protein [Theionarchaea archaeon]